MLPMPVKPSSVTSSTMVWMSSLGLSSSAQPPSTVPPASPVMRISAIFMREIPDSLAVARSPRPRRTPRARNGKQSGASPQDTDDVGVIVGPQAHSGQRRNIPEALFAVEPIGVHAYHGIGLDI